MVFDRTWKRLSSSFDSDNTQDQRLDSVFAAMEDHPFLLSSPEMARQVARFRIRLLDLN